MTQSAPSWNLAFTQKFDKRSKHWFYFAATKLYMLPMTFLAGLKIDELSGEQCFISLKYSFLTKNPFKSIYFACLSMAAELSTGLPALRAIGAFGANVSMLVVDMQASFDKKATGKIVFEFKESQQMIDAIKEGIVTKQSTQFEANTIGYNSKREIVAQFKFRWSFKVKQ